MLLILLYLLCLWVVGGPIRLAKDRMVFRLGPSRWDVGWSFDVMVDVDGGVVGRVLVFVMSDVWGLLSL